MWMPETTENSKEASRRKYNNKKGLRKGSDF
jgi:hypothetical protein